MLTHAKAVATLHTAIGALGILGALFIMLFYGGLASIIGLAAEKEDAAVAVSAVGIFLGFGALVLVILSLPSLIGGIGLLRGHGWARVLVLIVSCMELFHFPVGTAIGVYSIWALTKKELPLPSQPVRY